MQQHHQMAIQFFLTEMKAEIKPQTDSRAGLEKRPLPSAHNQELSRMQGLYSMDSLSILVNAHSLRSCITMCIILVPARATLHGACNPTIYDTLHPP